MMVRTIVLTAVLALSAAPAFACKNAMQPDEQEVPTRKAPTPDAPVTAQKKKAAPTAPPREQRQDEAQVVLERPSTSPDYALLGLAGVGLAGLTGAFVLRSRS